MAKLTDCLGTKHDWMPCGSTEVCVICGQSRARKGLPPWEFDKRGLIITRVQRVRRGRRR